MLLPWLLALTLALTFCISKAFLWPSRQNVSSGSIRPRKSVMEVGTSLCCSQFLWRGLCAMPSIFGPSVGRCQTCGPRLPRTPCPLLSARRRALVIPGEKSSPGGRTGGLGTSGRQPGSSTVPRSPSSARAPECSDWWGSRAAKDRKSTKGRLVRGNCHS